MDPDRSTARARGSRGLAARRLRRRRRKRADRPERDTPGRYDGTDAIGDPAGNENGDDDRDHRGHDDRARAHDHGAAGHHERRADDDRGSGTAALFEQHAVGMDRTRRCSAGGFGDRAPRLAPAPIQPRFLVGSDGGSRPALPPRSGRRPRPGLGRHGEGPGARRRGSVARGTGIRRPLEGIGRAPPRGARRPRGDTRDRPGPAPRFPAAEPGAAFVFDRADPSAGRAASGRAAAIERRAPRVTKNVTMLDRELRPHSSGGPSDGRNHAHHD